MRRPTPKKTQSENLITLVFSSNPLKRDRNGSNDMKDLEARAFNTEDGE